MAEVEVGFQAIRGWREIDAQAEGLDRTLAAVAGDLQVVAARSGQVHRTRGVAAQVERPEPVAQQVAVGIPHPHEDRQVRSHGSHLELQLAVVGRADDEPVVVAVGQNRGRNCLAHLEGRSRPKVVVRFKEVGGRGKDGRDRVWLDAARAVAAVAHFQVIATGAREIDAPHGVAAFVERRLPILEQVKVVVPDAEDHVQAGRRLVDRNLQLAVLVDRQRVPVGVAARQDGALQRLVERQRRGRAGVVVRLGSVRRGRERGGQGVRLLRFSAVTAVAHLQVIAPSLAQVDNTGRVAALVHGRNPIVDQVFVGIPDPKNDVQIRRHAGDLDLQFALMVDGEGVPVGVAAREDGALQRDVGVGRVCRTERIVGFAGRGGWLGRCREDQQQTEQQTRQQAPHPQP